MDIHEESYKELLHRVHMCRIRELMQEPYDWDMIDDDFWRNHENQKNYF
jgi:hypothetical protein